MVSGLQSRKLKLKNDEERTPKSAALPKECKRTWDQRMKRKAELQRIKDLSKKIKDELKAEAESTRAARRANRLRKEENERKNMVTQTIRNTRAIAKLSPKQRRKANIFLKNEL